MTGFVIVVSLPEAVLYIVLAVVLGVLLGMLFEPQWAIDVLSAIERVLSPPVEFDHHLSEPISHVQTFTFYDQEKDDGRPSGRGHINRERED